MRYGSAVINEAAELDLTLDLDASLCKGLSQQRFCSCLRDDAHLEGGFQRLEIDLGKRLPVLIPAHAPNRV